MQVVAGGAERAMRTLGFKCEEMWRPEAKRGQKWRAWEDLDDKR